MKGGAPSLSQLVRQGGSVDFLESRASVAETLRNVSLHRRVQFKVRGEIESRHFHDVGRLRTFLTFGDFELNLITFLQALVSLGGDCTVMNENIWPIVASNEPVPFRVIEPLHCTFQAIHL
jgi:hypothetical protein